MAKRIPLTKLTFRSLVLVMIIVVLMMISHTSLWYSSTNIRNFIYSEFPIPQKTLRKLVTASWLSNQENPLNTQQPIRQLYSNLNFAKNFYDQFRNKSFLMLKSPELKLEQIRDNQKDREIKSKTRITRKSSSEDTKTGDQLKYSCKRNKEWKIPSCSKLIAGDKSELSYALNFTKDCRKVVPTNNDVIKAASNCEEYRKVKKYIMYISEEEAKFPLAFSIMMYKDVNQVEELLKAIYRPHNYYCIHVDVKAKLDVHHAIHNITRCLTNVKLASRLIPVVWGQYTVLESELICMKDLLRYRDWKYLINLTGQEYPLKTNLQIVQILKLFHGANSVDTDADRHMWRMRWRKKGRPPHGIKPRKGNIHVVLNYQFVNYTINNQVSKDFMNWLINTTVPDETLFASLNNNPHLGIPGSYKGNENKTNWKNKPYIGRFKVWRQCPNSYFNHSCGGKWVREICIFGFKDLPILTQRVELFANKFHWNFQSVTLDCMQEWLGKQVEMEVKNPNKTWINETYYKNIPYLKDTIELSL